MNYTDKGFSLFSLFIGLKGKNLKFPKHNIWYFPISKEENYDLEKVRNIYLETQDPKYRYMFISFGSERANPDSESHSIQILAECKIEWVMKYRIN